MAVRNGDHRKLASFILFEILEIKETFFIAWSQKYKPQYGPERLARLL